MYDVSESVSVSYLDATARKVSDSYLDTKSGDVCVSYLDTFKKYLWTPLVKPHLEGSFIGFVRSSYICVKQKL